VTERTCLKLDIMWNHNVNVIYYADVEPVGIFQLNSKQVCLKMVARRQHRVVGWRHSVVVSALAW